MHSRVSLFYHCGHSAEPSWDGPCSGTTHRGWLVCQWAGLAFLALEKGDVSIVTPVMGVKLILVAFLMTWLLPTSVRPALWVAAALSCLSITLLHRGPLRAQAHAGRTIILALLAGAAYALFDVLIVKWAPAWGDVRFLPTTMLLPAILSLEFIPLATESLSPIAGFEWKSLMSGSVFMAAKAMVLVTTLAVFQDGTAVNVI